ncbi:MAG TPA: hypothetical protein VIH82_06105 [Acidimicrobiia bacterium]|jgi:hypothetical protein
MTKLLRTAVAVLVVAVTVWSAGASADAHDDHAGHEAPAGMGAEARDYARVWDDATKAERAAATDLIEATRAASTPWEDADAALAAGYVPRSSRFGPVHYANIPNRRDDGVLDPERPESLVYLQRPNGDPILLGVVYIVNRFQDRPTPAGPIAAWHVHDVPGCHHPDLDAGCSDVRGGMLHVWLYDGVVDPFADPMFASMGSRESWRTKLLDLAGI